MSTLPTLTNEEYLAKLDELRAKYPDYCEAADVEVLNLIMKKEFAEAILRGEKKVELRSYSQHYCERLIDKKVTKFIEAHSDDPDVLAWCDNLRFVKKIHFHNYNNSWFLDVECTANDWVAARDEDDKFLQERFGCDELTEMTRDLNAKKAKNRPIFFYFAIGKVIDTNLK